LALLGLASCIPIEWSTNSQGQLQSVGLPGVPVWQTQTLAEQKRLAAEGTLAAQPGSEVDPEAAKLTSTYSDADWLAEINRWREEAGVPPVGENVGLSTGAAEHAQYLVKSGPKSAEQFSAYVQAIDGAAHTENSDSPYYTQAGHEAAHTGDVAFDRDPKADVRGLVEAPFHRLSILAPWVRVAGYGDYGTWPMRAATLVLRGSTPVGLTKPVFFPPDGSTVTGMMKASEWPNPLDACPGYAFPVGTPITVQTGAFIKVSLESYSVQDESTGQAVETCGFDAMSYPVSWGKKGLSSYGAVVLIPRQPLTKGHQYRVNVKTHQHEYTWSFRVRGNNSSLRSARIDR